MTNVCEEDTRDRRKAVRYIDTRSEVSSGGKDGRLGPGHKCRQRGRTVGLAQATSDAMKKKVRTITDPVLLLLLARHSILVTYFWLEYCRAWFQCCPLELVTN